MLTLVFSQHNIALHHGMAQLYRAGHPMMLHGASGSGKTSIVADFLATLDPEQVRMLTYADGC